MAYIHSWEKKFDIWNYEPFDKTEVIQGKTYPKLRPISWGYQGIITVDGNGNVTSGIDLQGPILPGNEFFSCTPCNFAVGNCLNEWGAYRDIDGVLHYQHSLPTDGTWVGRSGLSVETASPYGGTGLGINLELKEFLDEHNIKHYPDFSGVSVRNRGAYWSTTGHVFMHYKEPNTFCNVLPDYSNTILNWKNWNAVQPPCMLVTEEHFITCQHFAGNVPQYSAIFARKDGGHLTVTGTLVGSDYDFSVYKLNTPLTSEQKDNIKIYSKWADTSELGSRDVVWWVTPQGTIKPIIIHHLAYSQLNEAGENQVYFSELRSLPGFGDFPKHISTENVVLYAPNIGATVGELSPDIWTGDSGSPLFVVCNDGNTYFGGQLFNAMTPSIFDKLLGFIINGNPGIPGSGASVETTLPTLVSPQLVGGAFPFTEDYGVVLEEEETGTNRILSPGSYNKAMVPVGLLLQLIKEMRLSQVNIYYKEAGGTWIKLDRNSYLTTAATITGVVDLSSATKTIQGITYPANIDQTTHYIRIRRESGEKPAVEFTAGSKLSSRDLNTDFNQVLHRIQETENNLNRDSELLALKTQDIKILEDQFFLREMIETASREAEAFTTGRAGELWSSISVVSNYLYAAIPFDHAGSSNIDLPNQIALTNGRIDNIEAGVMKLELDTTPKLGGNLVLDGFKIGVGEQFVFIGTAENVIVDAEEYIGMFGGSVFIGSGGDGQVVLNASYGPVNIEGNECSINCGLVNIDSVTSVKIEADEYVQLGGYKYPKTYNPTNLVFSSSDESNEVLLRPVSELVDLKIWKHDPTAKTTRLFDDLLWTGSNTQVNIEQGSSSGFLTVGGMRYDMDSVGSHMGKYGVLRVTFQGTDSVFRFFGPHTIYPATGQEGDKILWETKIKFSGISLDGGDFYISVGFASSGWVVDDLIGGPGEYPASRAFSGLCWSTQNQGIYPNLMKVTNNTTIGGNPAVVVIPGKLLSNYNDVWHTLGAAAVWDNQGSSWHIIFSVDGVVVGTSELSPAHLGFGLCPILNIFANTSAGTTTYIDWLNLQFTRQTEAGVSDISNYNQNS